MLQGVVQIPAEIRVAQSALKIYQFSDNRTEHAQQRAEEGRPIGTAWNDAKNAGRKVYYDTDTGNYVVKGENQRISIFTVEDGKLKVETSFRNPIKNTHTRIISEKWTLLSDEEYLQWQSLVEDALGEK